MSTPMTRMSPTWLVYPDSDGEPMAENTIQYQWIVTIKEGLEAVFRDRPDVFIAGDLFWYPIEGDTKTRTAPDVLVALDRPRGDRYSYLQWQEDDIAPQVVFEILSPGNRGPALARKQAFYEKFGVQEYYTYDPDDDTLKGGILEENAFTGIPVMHGWVSPLLGIRFDTSTTPLTIYKPDGSPFLTVEEIDRQREALAQKCEELNLECNTLAQERNTLAQERNTLAQERNTLAQERDEAVRRANEERERTRRLEARLRELGIEP